MKMTDKLFRAIMRNLHAYVLLINRDFTVFYTNYYDITGAVKPAETGRVGDILRCNNALSAAGGCGTHDLCEHCPVRNAIENAFVVRKNFTDLVAILNLRDSEGRTKEYNAYVSGEYMKIEDRDCMVITVHDITRLKQVENELKLAREKAENADRSKSVFLANMSHEIRTPLNAIVGFSELMAYAGEEEKADYIQIINSNNELLLKLINDILDLSKLEAGSVELKYEPFDLSEHFENMFTSMKQRLKNPDIVLTEINPYHCCRVTLDRNRVAQIITNYVTNAIKYTSKGSIKMGYACKDGGVYFYVKDTGIGIADDKKGKVFQRFEKLDEFAQGTGLGLSICKAIAEAMGGKVGFESVHNEGSLFWAFLPCEVDTLSMVEEKKEENISGGEFGANDEVMEKSAGRKTILIAEDIQSNYQLVSTILKDHYDLLHAENGQKAVEIARSQHVDLLLMDMKMPVLDGLKATAEIRKFNASLPIVALTAHAFDSDRIAAIKVGCNEYLVKPLEKMKLMVALKKYL